MKEPSKLASPPPPKPDTPGERFPIQGIKPTLVEHLFVDPAMFGDDEIKVLVWTRHADHSKEFYDALFAHMEETMPTDPLFRFVELLYVGGREPLPPGYFLSCDATFPRLVKVALGMIFARRPTIEFQGVTMNLWHDHAEYKGLRLGDARQLELAAKRALEETGGQDWYGGLATFATRFLRLPRGRRNAVH